MLVALQHVTRYFTEGALSTTLFLSAKPGSDSQLLRLGKTWKAISQGHNYKANLVREIERVGKLSEDIEKEAARNSQFGQTRMEDMNDILAAKIR